MPPSVIVVIVLVYIGWTILKMVAKANNKQGTGQNKNNPPKKAENFFDTLKQAIEEERKKMEGSQPMQKQTMKREKMQVEEMFLEREILKEMESHYDESKLVEQYKKKHAEGKFVEHHKHKLFNYETDRQKSTSQSSRRKKHRLAVKLKNPKSVKDLVIAADILKPRF